MVDVNETKIVATLKAEHRALHRWRRDEPYPFQRLNRLLDKLGYDPTAKIGWLLTPLAEAKARDLPKILPGLARQILDRASQESEPQQERKGANNPTPLLSP